MADWSYWGKPAPPPEVKPVWSTYELAEYLDMHPRTINRWCRDWFGRLQDGQHAGRRGGYQIPWQYLYVARAYLLTDYAPVRRALTPALTENPRNWVAVVDGRATTHYDVMEAVEQVLLSSRVSTILYAGEFKDRLR